MAIQSLSRKWTVASLAEANTGSPHVTPPSVEVETEMPDSGMGPEKTWKIEEYWNRLALAQATTGSLARMLKGSGPGFTKPRSVKERPRSSERATPTKLKPPVVVRVSSRLPESLKPTTTTSPHHPVPVSLCVKPVTIESVKSVAWSFTRIRDPWALAAPGPGRAATRGESAVRASSPACSCSTSSRAHSARLRAADERKRCLARGIFSKVDRMPSLSFSVSAAFERVSAVPGEPIERAISAHAPIRERRLRSCIVLLLVGTTEALLRVGASGGAPSDGARRRIRSLSQDTPGG